MTQPCPFAPGILAPRRIRHAGRRRVWLAAVLAALGGCSLQAPRPSPRDPAEVRAEIVRLMPSRSSDREGWARDIQAAFAALGVDATTSHLCAVLAVTAQESGYSADPAVPGLAKIARAEIDRRAGHLHIPGFMVSAALLVHSPDGRSYAERLDRVRTEGELSRIYEDLIGTVPLGKRLFGEANPVHTGGPMQVGIAFAEGFARDHGRPHPDDGSIRHAVFTRRGGLYFGIAHLLAYPVSYDRMLYRFADFNAGWYASRNAAFQSALALATGIPLALDGDLVSYERGRTGATENAVRSLGSRLGMADWRIHRTLAKGETFGFEQSELYRRVFELAERKTGHPLPRAQLPGIALESPKITRKLTTAWFAKRVDARYRQCLRQ
jgi:hypothetical protein